MEGGVKVDKWGYKVLTSSDACISAINEFYHQVLTYGRKRSVIMEATVHDKDCVLANILAVHFLSSSDPSRVPFYFRAAQSRLEQATSYEKAVFNSISCLISDNRDDDVAVDLHSKLLKDFPKDLVSLKRGQVLCFYMGRPDLSFNLVQQRKYTHTLKWDSNFGFLRGGGFGVLPPELQEISNLFHHYIGKNTLVLFENQQENYVYGMLAFALLELGCIADAEIAARKAYEINSQDCWAHHALCHVLQNECRFKEAVEFMESHSSSWESCTSFMITHNWWHVALCYLEGHSSIEKVQEIYDQRIWKELEKPEAIRPEVYLNALGLLLRVYVRGNIDVFEDHMKILSSYLTDQSKWYLEWHLDVLTLWALTTTCEFSKAEDLIKGLKSRFAKMSKKKQQLMQKGLVLAEALYEYGKGDEKRALELLGPDFDANDYKMIGASDEQLDIFNEVWYIMLLNTGQATSAIEAIEKRIKKREGVPFLWRLLERGYNMIGRQEAAITGGEMAEVLETAYFQ